MECQPLIPVSHLCAGLARRELVVRGSQLTEKRARVVYGGSHPTGVTVVRHEWCPLLLAVDVVRRHGQYGFGRWIREARRFELFLFGLALHEHLFKILAVLTKDFL